MNLSNIATPVIGVGYTKMANASYALVPSIGWDNWICVKPYLTLEGRNNLLTKSLLQLDCV